MLVSLHVRAALFPLSCVLPDRISAVSWFSHGPVPEAAGVDKGLGHLNFPVKAAELF